MPNLPERGRKTALGRRGDGMRRIYDWDYEGDFPRPPLKDAHAALVGDLLETELEVRNAVKKLELIDRIFDRAEGEGRR